MTVWPNGSTSKPYVSSAFGPRRAPIAGASTYHRGTDFSHTFSIIRAVAAGQVKVAGTPRGWPGGGTQVWVQHDGFFTRSLHTSSLLVREGQWVREGDPLCVMGRTGTATDTHLHFELTPGNVHYSNSGQVDPVPFLSNRISSPAGGGSSSPGGFLMALSDEQQKQMFDVLCGGQQKQFGKAIGIDAAKTDQMHEVLVGGQQVPFAKLIAVPIADEVLGRRITVQGREGLAGKGTNVASMVAWNDEHVTATIDAVNAGGFTEAQVKVIADAVVKAIGTPTAKVDYAAIAKAVNDDAAKRLAS